MLLAFLAFFGGGDGVNSARCFEWKFFRFETLVFVGVMQRKILEPMSDCGVLEILGYLLGLGVLGIFGLRGFPGVHKVESKRVSCTLAKIRLPSLFSDDTCKVLKPCRAWGGYHGAKE